LHRAARPGPPSKISPRTGSRITPSTGSTPASSPIETHQLGAPLRKFEVPSSGSTHQVRPEPPPPEAPVSSPSSASSGKRAASRVRIASSASRSACETKSLTPFWSITSAARRP
jgi:hypothetical protein